MDSIPENAGQLLDFLQDAAARSHDSGERFPLDNGQLARLSFKRKHGEEYPHAVISLDPSLEQAIIAAFVALRGAKVEKRTLLRVGRALLGAHWYDRVWEAQAKGKPRPAEPPGADRVTTDNAFKGFAYLYAEDLLRHYRSDFDDMPNTDQAALVRGVLEKANRFHDSLRELVLYIQHRTPIDDIVGPETATERPEERSWWRRVFGS